MIAGFAVSLVALAESTVLFRVGGRRAVARHTERASHLTAAPKPARATSPTPEQVYHSFLRAKRLWPWQVHCLQTAITLRRVFAHYGIVSVVRIGVRQDQGTIGAHAWVEAAGRIFDDAGIHSDHLLLDRLVTAAGTGHQ